MAWVWWRQRSWRRRSRRPLRLVFVDPIVHSIHERAQGRPNRRIHPIRPVPCFTFIAFIVQGHAHPGLADESVVRSVPSSKGGGGLELSCPPTLAIGVRPPIAFAHSQTQNRHRVDDQQWAAQHLSPRLRVSASPHLPFPLPPAHDRRQLFAFGLPVVYS